MELLNSKKDIEAACNIIENAKQLSGSDYNHYSKIFNFPTLKHKPLYTEMGKNWTDFLGVLGSSDPWLNAVCMGSKNITTFDINCLNVYFAYLKIAGILSLEYQEFLNYFYAQDWEQYFCKELYEKIKGNLPKQIKQLWDSLYEKYPHEKIRNLFFHQIIPNDNIIEEVVLPYNLFSEEKSYYHLKKLLVQIKFNYYIGDFGEIPEYFKGNQYDIIYLSCLNNLIYDNVHGYNYFTKLKEYDELLKPNGTIEGGYLYDYQTDWAWIEYSNKKFGEQGYIFTKVRFENDYYDTVYLKHKKS